MDRLFRHLAGTVEIGGGVTDWPPSDEEHEETRSALRTVPPTVFERRERCDTPISVVQVSAPHRDRATLTVLGGVDSGFVIALRQGETSLGRSKDATMAIEDSSISRMHARIVRTEDGQHVLEDLGSKNGTFVNGRAVSRVPLRSGDRVQLGPQLLLLFALVDEQEETLQRRLYESSTRDSLTGLPNRRRLLERLELEIARGETDGSDTGILMIDVDHFKQINDTYGHLGGDQMLCALAMSAERVLRRGVLLARYGGEEFAAVISCETKDDLVAVAERLRLSFGELRVTIGAASVGATVSVGVALWSECASGNYLELVALADSRMYAAKLAGRNRVCTSADMSAVAK
jgi:two-component system, cell cycle response regulator